MGGTAPRRARRRRPLQSVPSPLPQIPPCPSFSLGEGMPQPAPTRCPSRCTTQQPTQQQRQLRTGRCGNGQLPTTPTPPRQAGPQRQLCLPPLLSGSLAGRGGASMETSVPPVRILPTAGSAGHAPSGRRWSCALGGSWEQAQSPEPCPHPRPCVQPGTCPYATPCPQHSAVPMPFLMLCCPEGVCLSFPRQSSAGCPQGPHLGT